MFISNQIVIFAANRKGTTLNTDKTKFMEKEQLLSELKSKLGTTSLSERTLSEYVGSILPTITSDEQVNDTFYAAHVGILKSVAGQLNKDVADRVKTAQSEWEKNHPNPTPNPNPNPSEPKDEPNNKGYEELKAAIVAMQQKLDEAEKAKQANYLLESVKSAMKVKGATDEAVMLYTFKGESIDTTKSVDELTESYLKTYDANYRTLRGDGASPRNGDGNPNPKEDKFLDDYFARKASEGKFPESK